MRTNWFYFPINSGRTTHRLKKSKRIVKTTVANAAAALASSKSKAVKSWTHGHARSAKMLDPKTVCRECKNPLKPKNSVFEGRLICRACFDAENKRSVKEDRVPGKSVFFRKRPPKYMLEPDQFKKFGYGP